MKKVKIILVVIVILALTALSYFLFGNYGDDGETAGTLVKLSHKGYVFKTWEGDLNTYMIAGDQAAASAPVSVWKFSVLEKEEEAIKTMKEAMLNGHRIKLYYTQKFVQLPWNGDTKYFVYKAEIYKK